MAKQTVFKESRCMVKMYRMQKGKTASGGETYTRVDDGTEEIIYCTEINLSALETLAQRAARNKSGKAVDGPLTVYVTGRRRI